MKLTLKHFNVRSLDPVDSWVEQQILALGQVRQIDEASIRLAMLPEASPPYQVHVHLATPGPDVFADARDHTLRGAFTKVMTQLREKLAARTMQRERRAKSSAPVKATIARLTPAFR